MSENFKLLLILVSVAFSILILETLAKKKILSSESARKTLHISAGVLISLSPIIFSNFYYPLIFALAASVFSIAVVTFNFLPRIDLRSRGTLGTFYFSFSFALLVIFYWDNYRILISISYLLFVIGDVLASTAGNNSKKKIILAINSEPKTLQGAFGIFISILVLVAII